jgi:hypothetical protein
MLTTRGVARISRRAATGAQRAARLSTAAPVLAKVAAVNSTSQRAGVARSAGTSPVAGT